MEAGPGWGPDQPGFKCQDWRCQGLPAEAYLSTLDSRVVCREPLGASGGIIRVTCFSRSKNQNGPSIPSDSEKGAQPWSMPLLPAGSVYRVSPRERVPEDSRLNAQTCPKSPQPSALSSLATHFQPDPSAAPTPEPCAPLRGVRGEFAAGLNEEGRRKNILYVLVTKKSGWEAGPHHWSSVFRQKFLVDPVALPLQNHLSKTHLKVLLWMSGRTI